MRRSLGTFAVLFAYMLAQTQHYLPGMYKDMSKPTPFGGGCRPIEFTGGRLVAECPNFFGFIARTSLDDAQKCVDEKHDIENINGTLRCVISLETVKGPHPYGKYRVDLERREVGQ